MKLKTQNSAMAYRATFAESDLSLSRSFVIRKEKDTNGKRSEGYVT